MLARGVPKRKQDVDGRVSTMLVCGLQPDHGIYFGQPLCFKETVVDGAINVVLDKINIGNEGVDIEARDALIHIQMDDVTKAELLKRGTSVVKKWSSWAVVDSMERNMVSVTWRTVSSGIAETRMTCIMCRTDVLRRCRHERACERESELHYDSSELAVHEDEHGEASGSEHDSCDDGLVGGSMAHDTGRGNSIEHYAIGMPEWPEQ